MTPAPNPSPLPAMAALRSLRVRLLLATLVGAALALALAWLGLSSLFRDHVQQQFQISLTQQLDQLTARFSLDDQGQPVIDTQGMTDPRWQQPLSGLYWQVDTVAADGRRQAATLRSRSLWDTSLQATSDALPDGALHVHELAGPQGNVMLLERTVRAESANAVVNASSWRLMVAADLQSTHEAIERFNRLLAASLGVLLVLLAGAAWAQVAVGLKPLKRLQQSLQNLQNASTARLEGRFPQEVQPLVDDFNRVLEQNHAVVERARTQAGNLAHALKTPLSVLDQLAAAELGRQSGQANAISPLPQQVREQVLLARKHIDWHLARARVAATQRLPGQRTAIEPAIRSLVRVMEKVHADRALEFELQLPPARSNTESATGPAYFAGEEQDLHEMLGNLLDNACKWARHKVVIGLTQAAPSPLRPPSPPSQAPRSPYLQISVQDDGPGIDAAHLETVKARGARLDESVPGTGLGLAIVQDLAGLYGGSLDLQQADGGGLRVTLHLPGT